MSIQGKLVWISHEVTTARTWAVMICALGAWQQALAAEPNVRLVRLDPDDYVGVLNNAIPEVELYTTTTIDFSTAALGFNVTSTIDGFGYAPTGTRVFAHSGVFFFNSDRRLRMIFAAPVSGISLDFAGGTYFDTDSATLAIYDVNRQQLNVRTISGLSSGEVTTISFDRLESDIAYAYAYGGFLDFTRIDNLVIRVAVPEPHSAILLTVAMLSICGRSRFSLRNAWIRQHVRHLTH